MVRGVVALESGPRMGRDPCSSDEAWLMSGPRKK
jgi:hypothetical protein